jgi:parvulin-like peptidyl-prolyl isomerase
MTIRLPFSAPRPRTPGRVGRARSIGLPLVILGALLTFVLAGCGSIASDPLVAATVDGHSISLAAYQRMLSIYEVTAAQQQNQQVASWRTPAGRSMLATLQRGTLDALTNIALTHEQVQQQRITVKSADVAAQVKSLATQVDRMLSQVPDNADVRELDRGAHDALKQHPGSQDVYALLEGRPSTADALTLLAWNQVEQAALLAHGKVPSVHLRLIEVAHQSDATHLKQQAQGGADFGQLARTSSLDQQTGQNGGDLGVVYAGQLSSALDQYLFSPAAIHAAQKYVTVPFQGKYVLFEVTQRGRTPLASITDTTTASGVLNSWLSLVVKPSAQIAEFVAIDPTPNPAG